MKSLWLSFTSNIVPKKNGKTAGIFKHGPRRGQVFIYSRAAAKESQKELAWEAISQTRDWKVTDKPVRVLAIIRKRRGDCIGAMETILDAMERIVYINDRQVVDQRSYWAGKGELRNGETARVLIDIL